MRNTSGVMRRLNRDGDTNQKLRFDIDWGGAWLVAGDQVGFETK